MMFFEKHLYFVCGQALLLEVQTKFIPVPLYDYCKIITIIILMTGITFRMTLYKTKKICLANFYG